MAIDSAAKIAGAQPPPSPQAASEPPVPDEPPVTLRERWERIKPRVIITLFVFAFLVVMLWNHIFYTVHPGEGGILFLRFGGGTVTDRVFDEGLHIVIPFNKFYIYDLRTQARDEVVHVQSTNGLTITVNVTVVYRPIHDQLGHLHQDVGPDYEQKLVIPAVVASVREIIGKYRPDELYTSHRTTIQDEVLEAVKERIRHKYLELGLHIEKAAEPSSFHGDSASTERKAAELQYQKYIWFYDVIIRSIKLPDVVNDAIEAKLRQEQQAQEYEFRLAKEEKEKERKKIEAEGISTYQNTVNSALSSNVLIWEGIQATLELARSPNSKVVIFGSSGDKGGLGLPIILGSDLTPEKTGDPTLSPLLRPEPSIRKSPPLPMRREEDRKSAQPPGKNSPEEKNVPDNKNQ